MCWFSNKCRDTCRAARIYLSPSKPPCRTSHSGRVRNWTIFRAILWTQSAFTWMDVTPRTWAHVSRTGAITYTCRTRNMETQCILGSNKISCKETRLIITPLFSAIISAQSNSRFCNFNLITEQASHGLWGSAGLKIPIHTYIFRWVILTGNIAETDKVFGVQSGLVGLCMHDYESLCVAAMICATLVNIQTCRQQHYDQQSIETFISEIMSTS